MLPFSILLTTYVINLVTLFTTATQAICFVLSIYAVCLFLLIVMYDQILVVVKAIWKFPSPPFWFPTAQGSFMCTARKIWSHTLLDHNWGSRHSVWVCQPDYMTEYRAEPGLNLEPTLSEALVSECQAERESLFHFTVVLLEKCIDFTVKSWFWPVLTGTDQSKDHEPSEGCLPEGIVSFLVCTTCFHPWWLSKNYFINLLFWRWYIFFKVNGCCITLAVAPQV